MTLLATHLWIDILCIYCVHRDIDNFCIAFPHYEPLAYPHIDSVCLVGDDDWAKVEGKGLNLHRVRQVTVENAPPARVAACLQTLAAARASSLEALHIRFCVLTRPELRLLRESVDAAPRLHMISVEPALNDYQGLEDIMELKALFRSLRRRPLTRLVLTSVRSDSLGWEGASGAALLDAIGPPRATPLLRTLVLSRIVPSGMAFRDFVDGVNANKALETLEIRHCRLPRTRVPLPDPLDLPALKHFVFSHVQCSPPYMHACILVPALLYRLETLTLRRVPGAVDVAALKETVHTYGDLCSLRRLDFVRDQMKMAGVGDLMGVLQRCPHLTHLTLGGMRVPASSPVLLRAFSHFSAV